MFGKSYMRAASHISLILVLLSAVGCSQRHPRPNPQDALAASLPHDASIQPPDASANFTNQLTAEGGDWSVSVRWNSGESERFVTWREGGDGFSLGIPLRTRPKPFTTSDGGVTITRYGPYQPACVLRRGSDDWHVQMSHEQADFPSEADLTKFLEQSIPGQPHAHPVLSPDGIMVTLRSPLYSRFTSLDVEIWILTVNGKMPSPSLLKPFLGGTLRLEPN